MRTYHTAIEEIQLAVARNETASVREIDRLVAEVLASRETACIAPLLCCLDDRFEAQEAMFAIIHAAESFADEHYIPAYRSCREVTHDGRCRRADAGLHKRQCRTVRRRGRKVHQLLAHQGPPLARPVRRVIPAGLCQKA